MRVITYGLGGHCEKCSPKHDHPLNNIISDEEIIEGVEVTTDPPTEPAP